LENNRGVAGLVLAGMLFLSTPAIVFSAGEHSRRAGAELQVLIGDLGRLEQPALPEKQVRGLKARIRGTLAALPLLLRLADQEQGRAPIPMSAGKLVESFGAGPDAGLQRRLRMLAERYPFRGTGILPASASPRRLSLARELHQTLCAACHDTPDLDRERPAFNLFLQARSMPLREFAARMLVGIRGDAVTGVDNPFTDEELAALIAFYRNAAVDRGS